ncbi:MAG: cupin domain-containing protein [Candidatus Marinimicrobia bacterium]|nr:cupin domain-containing protein [Candidatus Neomarinimicrobiota bacterium]
MTNDNFFPNIITNLPHADIPIEGLSSYLIQCPDRQLIFMSFGKDAEVGEHRHAGQWAAVLDGQIELTVNDRKQVYTKGDTYFIPANVPHSARITAGYKDMTLFDQKDRYREKTV